MKEAAENEERDAQSICWISPFQGAHPYQTNGVFTSPMSSVFDDISIGNRVKPLAIGWFLRPIRGESEFLGLVLDMPSVLL